MLHEAARAGPITTPVDVRDTDELLVTLLTPLLGVEEALRYNSDHLEHTLGYCEPGEFTTLAQKTRDTLQWQIRGCLYLNSKEWQRKWERLDHLPQFWDTVTRKTTPEIVTHLRTIGDVARYAVAHNLLMLKIGA